MKKTKSAVLASILAATMLTLVPLTGMSFMSVSASANTAAIACPENGNLKEVTKTGDLSISLPEKVTDQFKVNAYEILQLVVNKDTTIDAAAEMTNTSPSLNLYVPTDPYINFFKTAKETYLDDTKEVKLFNENKLYLTYNATENHLEISNVQPTPPEGVPVNEYYIEIDNSVYKTNEHAGRLDPNFFEGDLVSRIVDSPAAATDITASSARLFSDWVSRYTIANHVTKTKEAQPVKEGEKITSYNLKDLYYGYYVVIVSDDTEDTDHYTVINQSILNVPLAKDVTLKTTPITVDKSVINQVDANRKNNEEAVTKNDSTTRADNNGEDKYDKITANIGDILGYTVASHIPSYTSYDFEIEGTPLLPLTTELTEDGFNTAIANKYVYTFRDTMNFQSLIAVDDETNHLNGLKVEVMSADKSSVEKTFVVKKTNDKLELVDKDNAGTVVGRLWVTEYTSTAKKTFFAVNFDIVKLKALSLDGRDVKFIYNAELMGEAGSSNSDNTATITYSNDPFDASTTDTISHTNYVYTYDLKLNKKFSDGSEKDNIQYVTFKLYSDAEKKHAIKFVLLSDGSYVRADSNDVDEEKTPTDILDVNDTTYTLQLHGLGEGVYYLEEQPNNSLKQAGYNVVNTVEIVVSAKNNGAVTDETNFDLFKTIAKPDDTTEIQTGVNAKLDQVDVAVSPFADEYGAQFDIINQKGFKLPLTGEYGNWTLAIAGILLIAVSGTVIVLVNRRKNKKSNEK